MKESSKEILKLKGVVRNLRNRLAASKKFAAKKVNECADLAYTVSDLKNSLKEKDEVITDLGKELKAQKDIMDELSLKYDDAKYNLVRSEEVVKVKDRAVCALGEKVNKLELMIKQYESMYRLSEAGNDFKDAMLDYISNCFEIQLNKSTESGDGLVERMEPIRRKRKNFKK